MSVAFLLAPMVSLNYRVANGMRESELQAPVCPPRAGTWTASWPSIWQFTPYEQ